ncbi:alpha-1,4-N-acetylglucosaminyltransferase-like [Symsagittifera roscoffensis]|uniref:alpha-1,4-N-acetylglucosaminyltransferase-like n=1 Tax=Symsagittifera roscoffensis TaxID=84072 RepID=UPI00307B2AC9
MFGLNLPAVCDNLKAQLNRSVWILETKVAIARPRLLCAAESVARAMPDYCIRVLIAGYDEKNSSSDELTRKLRAKFENVRFQKLVPEDILRNTPVANYTYRYGPLFEWDNYAVHLSDFLRMALLYKYGGIYMDTDILARGRIDPAPFYVSRADGGAITNSVIGSSRPGHPLLWVAMNISQEQYMFRQYDTVFGVFGGLIEKTCLKERKRLALDTHTVRRHVLNCSSFKVYGFETGSLCCKKYSPLNGENQTESETLMQQWRGENCTMFHYMQSYLGVKQALTPHKNSLLKKVMKDTCPMSLESSELF